MLRKLHGFHHAQMLNVFDYLSFLLRCFFYRIFTRSVPFVVVVSLCFPVSPSSFSIFRLFFYSLLSSLRSTYTSLPEIPKSNRGVYFTSRIVFIHRCLCVCVCQVNFPICLYVYKLSLCGNIPIMKKLPASGLNSCVFPKRSRNGFVAVRFWQLDDARCMPTSFFFLHIRIFVAFCFALRTNNTARHLCVCILPKTTAEARELGNEWKA